MTMDFCSYFSFTAEPFSKEVEDGELWLPPSKQMLLETLIEAAHARKSVLLAGDPGVGKTCLLRALRHALSPQTFRLTYCANVTLGRRDFYRQLCLALGLARCSTAGDVFYAVSTHVEELAKERVFPVFVLDEAHLLHQDTLDHLHILLNYAWDSRALLSLVLLGLPELGERLRVRRNRSLYSRLHYRLTIDPLTPDDTADYLRVRLGRVGCTKELFTSDAIAMLHEAAAGSLRDTDRLATAALRAAARKKRKLVERDVLSRILQLDAEEAG
ncbi:AAA family ATPase [Sorangium sp. So ce726]|uniref:ExeA family protein n=1 Tax=Sorangium sp. So ce726 TaxID=3133319 RepID=UPI003F5EBA9A